MTKKKVDQDPNAPKKRRWSPQENVRQAAKKRRGWLLCDRCAITVEHTEGPEGWPLHRCTAGRISEVRPFDRWTDKDPKPPLTSTPSPLEGP